MSGDAVIGQSTPAAATPGVRSRRTTPKVSPRAAAPSAESRMTASPSATPAATARNAFREDVEAKGHAVDNVRTGMTQLRAAIERGDIRLTPAIEHMLGDLHA